MATKKKMLQAAAGNAGGAGGAGGAALDITDVFSTYLYEGNGSAQTINNGIALGDAPDDGVYYLSSPSSLTGNNSAVSSVSATVDGNVTLSSGTNKFASNSYDFDGASNIRLSRALIDTASSFCFETWVYFDSTGVSNDMAMLLAQYKSGEDGRLLFGAQNGNLVVRYNGGNAALTASVSASTWLHVAWSYDGTTHRLFINGNLEDSTTLDFPIYTGVTTQLGGTDPTLLSGYDLDGKMEDIRITTGDARYTSSFSPPTASLPVTTEVTDGEGGLVWTKDRDTAVYHALTDTERGGQYALYSPTSDAQVDRGSDFITSFNSNGYSIGADGLLNDTYNYVSWTFRKAPKFFTCLTYTGTGSAQTIAHDLGSDVGFLLIKRTDSTSNWRCWHRGLPGTGSNMEFNQTGAYETATAIFNGTDPTSTQFSVGTNSNVNASGGTYVAYLFAHNDGDGGFGPDGDQDIIKCGSYTGNGSTDGPEIDLGFEPQWLLWKNADGTDNWEVADVMRGMPADGTTGGMRILRPNTSGSEFSDNETEPKPTGFKITNPGGNNNGNGSTYIYMAIRRGPLAQPESGTEVFDVTAYTGDGTADRTIGNLTVDMNIVMDRTNTSTGLSDYHTLFDRVRGEDIVLKLTRTDNEGNGWGNTYYNLDQQYGFSNGSNTSYFNNSGSSYISYIWKRAPGFCDVVAYTGTGATHTVSHNLGVAPEMIIVKSRSSAEDWTVFHEGSGTLISNTFFPLLFLNQSAAATPDEDFTSQGMPTATSFTLNGADRVNSYLGNTYIAYLFATVPGVSKVGSYTGTGQTGGDINVDCGFTSGARFVMIKRTDASGSWWVADTARGIVSGNEPLLALNYTSAELTGYNMVEPYSSGFIVNGSGGGDNSWNDAGGNYIFYAIA